MIYRGKCGKTAGISKAISTRPLYTPLLLYRGSGGKGETGEPGLSTAGARLSASLGARGRAGGPSGAALQTIDKAAYRGGDGERTGAKRRFYQLAISREQPFCRAVVYCGRTSDRLGHVRRFGAFFGKRLENMGAEKVRLHSLTKRRDHRSRAAGESPPELNNAGKRWIR